MAAVIVGRAIQGLGGSGLDVLNEIITADMTTLKERPLYLGILAIPMAAGAIMGPPVGALLSQFVRYVILMLLFALSSCFNVPGNPKTPPSGDFHFQTTSDIALKY
jgi:MFS family permease